MYSLKNLLQTVILSKLHSLSICHLFFVFCSSYKLKLEQATNVLYEETR